VSVHRGVVRLVGAPVTDEQQLRAALLRCGEGARCGPSSSAWLLGLEGYRKLAVDVVLPAPRRARSTAFPVLTRSLEVQDRLEVRGLPSLGAVRTIIELAAGLDPKQLRVLIDSARRTRRATVPLLKERALELVEEPGSRSGSLAVLRAIGEGGLAKESEAERTIARFLASTTLRLRWQVTDLLPGRRFDAVDDEAQMIVESDSKAWHTLGSDRDADHLRDMEVAEALPSWLVVRVTLGMVRYEPEQTRRHLDALRAQRVQGRSER
jgi:hypothetical protein